jgi:hypothetical protein
MRTLPPLLRLLRDVGTGAANNALLLTAGTPVAANAEEARREVRKALDFLLTRALM